MKIKVMQVGEIGTNCYLLEDETTSTAAIIDPGDNASAILSVAEQDGMTIQCILLTHGHFDHILAVPGILSALPNLPVYITELDYPLARDGRAPFSGKMGEVPSVVFYDEGDVVTVGSIPVKVIRTPGHTPGSVTLLAEDVLFTGDTLFRGCCGRTDLPGGDFDAMMNSLKKLGALNPKYQVLPGHEDSSTLENELRFNPYLQQALER